MFYYTEFGGEKLLGKCIKMDIGYSYSWLFEFPSGQVGNVVIL